MNYKPNRRHRGEVSLQQKQKPVRLCLFGAAPNHTNLGVSALFLSTLNAIAERHPNAAVSVFDFDAGVRTDTASVAGKPFHYKRIGANFSRRFYRSDSLINMRVSAALGGLANPGVKEMANADAMLDISGGDSFSDIYGLKRFKAITQAKQLALRMGTPLILLPQTYGPFELPTSLTVAQDIVRRSSMAWARDNESFETLKLLAGEKFAPSRHLEGVDVAFLLPKEAPHQLPEHLVAWINERSQHPVIGLNVSGLIHNQADAGKKAFGLRADYHKVIQGVVHRFLQQSETRIVLVPHVQRPLGHYESDLQACKDVAKHFNRQDRIYVLDTHYNAMQMKWVIQNFDFFCGTRMHSTIAGLSSGLPTAAIAYSKKTLGVFSCCGQANCVTDPRDRDSDACIEDIWRVWLARDTIAYSLKNKLPEVIKQAKEQFTAIFDHIDSIRTTSSRFQNSK